MNSALRIVFFFCLLFCVFLVIGGVAAQDAEDASCSEPLRSHKVAGRTIEFDQCYRHTFSYNGSERKAIVYYTLTNGTLADRLMDVDTNGDGINDTTAEEIAAQIGAWTEEAWRAYLDYGFDEPQGRHDIDVYVYDMQPGKLGWCCGSRHYEIEAPHIIRVFAPNNDMKDGMATVFHEMWHASQWSGKGGWIDEGTASNMTDHVNLLVDLDSNNDYIGRVRSYLGSGVDQSLTTHSYGAALWWTYYMERIGTTITEPDRGVDAMLQFWQDLGSDGLTTIDTIARDLPDANMTLESLWMDFTVANYAKELTGSGVSPQYLYEDELQIGAPNYPSVKLSVSEFLDVDDSLIATTDIDPWAAKYYELRPNPAVPIINLEFRQDTNIRLGYTLLLIHNGNLVAEERYVGRDFVRSFINDTYDQVVIVVTSLSEFANYRYSINGTEPVLNIIDPLQNRKAQAGDPAAPEKILVKVEILSPLGGGVPVAGIDPDDFNIMIGSVMITPEQIISSAYIQGQYWLLLRSPTQTTTGSYDLTVELSSTLSDTSPDAVWYETRADADNVLVIDRSGSMSDFDKITAAQNAARLYIDSWREGDMIGVISYSSSATVDLTLRDWNTTSRNEAFTAINELSANGSTSIGDGLLNGLDELIVNGDSDHAWALILLSDGLENEDPRINNFMDAYENRIDEGELVPTVHTIALGPDADRDRLEQLAGATGGTYHYAAEPPSTNDASLSAVQGLDLNNDLAEIYRVIGEEVSRQQQIYATRGVVPYDGVDAHTITIDGAASEVIIALNWSPSYFSAPLVTLSQPDGTDAGSPLLSDTGHLIWRISTPMAGDWVMTIQQHIDDVFRPTGTNTAQTYLLETAVASDLSLDVYLALATEDRLAGNPMPILVSLSDNLPLPGATIQAQITDPSNFVWDIELYDDGNHDDGAAADGFYGNTFYQTYSAGSYVAVVTAKGDSSQGEAFYRRMRISFNMKATFDSDGDGIPDWWEIEHGTNPNANDADADPDQDGLTSAEEFQFGTDPQQSDSDNGGENDGSEASNGTNLNDPIDDQIGCILDFQATNVIENYEELLNPEASVLHFSVAPEHDHFVLWRSTNSTGPWQLVNDQIPPTGEFVDLNVTLGVTYYYQLQAVNSTGHGSCILGPRSTTPKEDPIPPQGFVLISDGAKAIRFPETILTLEASTDTVEMMVSNFPDMRDSIWETYLPSKAWELAPQNYLATVYVKYRDSSGNVSEIVQDSIWVIDADFGDAHDPPYLTYFENAGAYHDDYSYEWLGARVTGEADAEFSDTFDDGIRLYIERPSHHYSHPHRRLDYLYWQDRHPVQPHHYNDPVRAASIIIRVNTSGLESTRYGEDAEQRIYLQGWIDLNGDGVWNDPEEKIVTCDLAPGTVGFCNGRRIQWHRSQTKLQISVRNTFETELEGWTWARFRLSYGTPVGPTGPATYGEVEDYPVRFSQPNR